MTQQVRPALCPLCDPLDRTAKVDIDDAHAIVLNQPLANLGQCRGVVIPDLHCQRLRFVGHTPESLWMLCLDSIHPDKPAGVDHLGRLQAGAAKLTHNLAIGVIRKACHRRLQHRRIHLEIANHQGSNQRSGRFGTGRRDNHGVHDLSRSLVRQGIYRATSSADICTPTR